MSGGHTIIRPVSRLAPTTRCKPHQTQSQQRQRSGLRHVVRRPATGRGGVCVTELDRRALHAHGETVPVLIAQTAPTHGVESALELQRAMRVTGAEELIFGLPADGDDVLVRGPATPVPTRISITGMTKAEDVEILIEGVTVAVQADVGKNGI